VPAKIQTARLTIKPHILYAVKLSSRKQSLLSVLYKRVHEDGFRQPKHVALSF